MTTFSSAIRLCGLSRREAADYFGVRLDTVGSWSSGSNPVPPGVWDMLADLWRRIEDAAEEVKKAAEETQANKDVFDAAVDAAANQTDNTDPNANDQAYGSW
jgi:hypothetical protein